MPFHLPTPLSLGQKRKMVFIDSQGRAKAVEVSRHNLVAELGIPYRDLRILEPWVYSSMAIFIRDKALVVNLEAVRMIICKDQVYVLGVRSGDRNGDEGDQTPLLDEPFIQELCTMLGNKSSGEHGKLTEARLAIDWDLPFELRAVEAALGEAIRQKEVEVDELEDDCFPALETLTHKISSRELERVREIKRRMNTLLQKVSTMRRVVEELLQDDMDMMDMYLGKKAEREGSLGTSCVGEMPEGSHAPTPGDASLAGHIISLRSPTPVTVSNDDVCGGLPLEADSDVAQQETASESVTEMSAGLMKLRSFSASQLERLTRDQAQASKDVPRRRPQVNTPNVLLRPVTSLHDIGQRQGAAARKGLLDRMLIGAEEDVGSRRGAHTPMWLSTGNVSVRGSLRERATSASRSNCRVDPGEVAGVEALLEAYFMQIDFTLNRLLQLKERIDDTEDLIVIDLDHRRNELHALEILIVSITLMFSFVATVAGIFGMNLASGAEGSQAAFAAVIIISIGAAVAMFAGLMAHIRSRRLMFIPERPAAAWASRPLHPQRQSLAMWPG